MGIDASLPGKTAPHLAREPSIPMCIGMLWEEQNGLWGLFCLKITPLGPVKSTKRISLHHVVCQSAGPLSVRTESGLHHPAGNTRS
jgi:hypothetical protein